MEASQALFTFWKILIFPVRFEIQNFYPEGEFLEFDNKHVIRCLLLKYRLIFLLVRSHLEVSVFDERYDG